MIVVSLAFGLVLLIAGGELLVRGGVATAGKLGVSPLLVGLTVVAFGTSSPELVASLTAALRGAPGIAVGNVVGSNISNILLILGGASLLAPMAARGRAFIRDGGALLAATLAFVVMAIAGELTRLAGLLFVVALIAFLVGCYLTERRAPGTTAMGAHEPDAAPDRLSRNLPLALLVVAVGLAALAGGATLLVDSAVDLARRFGIPDTVIGLTVVAIGTSLPEFATTIIAARRGQADVAVGNVVGSNIFNILCILGVTAVVQPVVVPPEIARVDIWVMLAATLLLIFFVVSRWRIERWEGAVLFGGYVAYLSWLVAMTRSVG